MTAEFHVTGGRSLQPAEACDFTAAGGRMTGVGTTQGILLADIVVLATAADLIGGTSPLVDPAPFRPGRFE